MGFYTIDNKDLEEVCRVRYNSMLLFMTYLQLQTKIKVYMLLYLTLQKYLIGFLMHFL